MDYIILSNSEAGDAGILTMLEHFLGPHDYSRLVDVGVALMVIEIAKRADDRPEWFIRGKWTMIQAIQGRIAIQIDAMMAAAKETE